MKVAFINKSITEADIFEELKSIELERPKANEKMKRLVYFFDPPWGGLNYQAKSHMSLFGDFSPYPMREALTHAFSLTNNVMLKLPKNIII